MNFNNRSDYLQGILDALNGLYYYLNDYNSTGILYYEVGDLYNVRIGENTYQCLMLNDEINVTTGIEEIIHTDMPEKSETDYAKADKTDMRINKTYLIVDKQNQEIEAVVKQTVDPTNPESTVNKVSKLNIRVGELESSIKDIADITTYGESDRGYVELDGINQSEPIMIKVHPTSTNISYLYPRENLYPSDLQFMPDRVIQFKRTYNDEGTTKTEYIYYTLPDDLLRYSSEVYDEFYLDYDSHICQVIKRCAYNADGTVRALGTEITTNYEYPQILLGDGDYSISLLGYDYGYVYVRLMAQNIYTTQFATKAEVTSEINQTAQAIDLSVNQKLTNYSTTTEMNSAITVKANEINSTVSQKVGKDEVCSVISQRPEEISIRANRLIVDSTNFKLTKTGNLTCKNANITGKINATSGYVGKFNLDSNRLTTYNGTDGAYMTLDEKQIYFNKKSGSSLYSLGNIGVFDTNTNINFIRADGNRSKMFIDEITAETYNRLSLESIKKNIERYRGNAIELIKSNDVYQYNFKTEKNNTKKHIGFVIPDKGGNYKTPDEVIAQSGKGIDTYTMTSILWKAVQEQQEQIEQMKKEIEILKGGNK